MYKKAKKKKGSDVVHLHEKKRKIDGIQFFIGNPEHMRRLSHVEVCENDIYNVPSGRPVRFGVNDEQLGISNKTNYCTTCGMGLQDCVGHFGYIQLELPVFHIGFFKSIIRVLQKICKSCSKILLTDVQRMQYFQRFQRVKEIYNRKLLNDEVLKHCKKNVNCPHCNEYNGGIKKVGAMKIVHEKYKVRTKSNRGHVEKFYKTFNTSIEHNKDIKHYISKAQEDLNPITVLKLFKNIPVSDIYLLDMDPTLSRPENMIWTHMLVPPCCIRPSVPTHGGTNEDDLTTNLSRIITLNKRIKEGIGRGEKIETIIDLYDELHFQCAQFVNSELPGFSAHQKTGRVQRSLVQRLKGKSGRFRGNLCGKRVDFSGRSVISPDPNLEIDQVAIPMFIAKKMTFPEKVFEVNKKWLQKLIINGHDKHPGAVYVTLLNGTKKSLIMMGVKLRKKLASSLRIGEIVERHMVDNDIVLFNRQPSLHRISIMCHRTKILPYRTLRFNLCVCTPYNADFDGDEMNIHFPQTVDARAEALNLMGVLKNMCTPRNGDPIVSALQDFITAAYLITKKDSFFSRDEICQMITYMNINERIDLPKPCIVFPIELWTGKQVIRVLLKPNKQSKVRVNLESKGKSYSRKGLYFCENDSYICFRNSELISGTLDKKILGTGNKQSLFYCLMRNFGNDYAGKCMGRLSRLCANWLQHRGFSIGMDDVIPTEELNEYKRMLIKEETKEFEHLIEKFNKNELKPSPGCTIEQTLEATLNKNFSDIRSKVGTLCCKNLHYTNSLAIMSRCGSKGSANNISQMMALVGQQSVGGKRIENGFEERTLPHFKLFDKSPNAKGFIANSFFTGLNATEFFFHTMAGREGLVDTAVKTSQTGYMQRRLMKALEDLCVQYDGTLRSSEDVILQFQYGDDNMDPLLMEGDESRPINLKFDIMNARNWNMPKNNDENVKVLRPNEIRQKTKEFLDRFCSNCDEIVMPDKSVMKVPGRISIEKPFSWKFKEEFEDFMNKIANESDEVMNQNDFVDEDFDVDWKVIKSKSSILTEKQLDGFFQNVKMKYLRGMAEPGEAMGAIAGQSIGEPGTQMTLKTFHFAGVASMNITLGVPRILEIINATKNIKTPIITSELTINEESAAKIVKGRIERTTLGEICKSIEEVEEESDYYIKIVLDQKMLDTFVLNLTFPKVRHSIVSTSKIGLKPEHIKHDEARGCIVVRIPTDENSIIGKGSEKLDHTWYVMQRLKEMLKNVVVSGITNITRAVVKKKKNSNKIELVAEGIGLLDVMCTQGVNSLETVTNNVLEVQLVLGIEAARGLIMDQIDFTMAQHGMIVDERHLKLLSDLMTNKGMVLGINRHGILKMRNSVMLNASFERTTDHLFNAAIHTLSDDLRGVSESIIVGNPIGVGTGMVTILHDMKLKEVKKKINKEDVIDLI